MDEQHAWEPEVDSVTELIIVGLTCMVGFGVLMTMILSFNARVNEFERYDKVAANMLYENACSHTYKLTPFQAYIMGYGIDEWSPEETSIKWYANPSNYIVISESRFNGDLRARNNMISGNLNTSPSVRGVLEAKRGTRNMTDFYRGSTGQLIMSWTDQHNPTYDTFLADGITIFEKEKRDFEWVIE